MKLYKNDYQAPEAEMVEAALESLMLDASPSGSLEDMPGEDVIIIF